MATWPTKNLRVTYRQELAILAKTVQVQIMVTFGERWGWFSNKTKFVFFSIILRVVYYIAPEIMTDPNIWWPEMCNIVLSHSTEILKRGYCLEYHQMLIINRRYHRKGKTIYNSLVDHRNNDSKWFLRSYLNIELITPVE